METGTCDDWFDENGLPYAGVPVAERAGGKALWWAPGYLVFRDGLVARNGVSMRWSVTRGRPLLSVFDARTKSYECKAVVRMVGEAFCPEFRESLRAVFVNGNKLDVRPENVRWVSCSEVSRKKRPPGWRTAKLTADDVLTIRRCEESDESAARRFGISAIYVFQLRQGRYWKHLKNENHSQSDPCAGG